MIQRSFVSGKGTDIMGKRLEFLDILRAVFCTSILLYHMSILKGGYLAVCGFFTLSGYLSSKALEKNDFSIFKYYKDRLLRVYVPMILVVLTSLGICLLLLPDVVWVSMKREVTSLLLGYNNFWQISANLDYFARHVDSPFMHLWYVAILLQLDLLFPLILKLLKWAKNTISNYAPIIITLLVGISSLVYFLYLHREKGLMYAYYNTFARAFSWLFGMTVGFVHIEREPLILSKIKSSAWEIWIFVLLVLCEVLGFLFVGAESRFYVFAMIAITILTCRGLSYVRDMQQALPNWLKKPVNVLVEISYEIYLVQYPVIYLFQYVKLPKWIANACIIGLVLVLSYCLHIAINLLFKITSFDVASFILLIVLIFGSVYGGYRYVTAKDLQGEMKKLEKEMEKEKEEQELRQKEYEEQLQAEEDAREKEEEALAKEREKACESIDERLVEIERKEDYYWDRSGSANVTLVGDSVMLGAVTELCDTFSHGYVDAEKNRTGYAINMLLKDLKERNIIGNQVVISCGANGDCPESVKDEIMTTLSDKEVFWMTTPNNPSANETLKEYATKYSNLYVIDWAVISDGHSEYFAGDGLHLAGDGKAAFAQAIRQGMYDCWVEELEQEKKELLQQKEELG